MVINIEDGVFCMSNVKPNSWYVEFYGDWILEFYENYNLEQCIRRQMNIDKMIDKDQFEKDEKFDTLGLKGFVMEINSLQKNKDTLNKYKQNLILFTSKYGKDNSELFELMEQLIDKCEEALEQKYLVTNQLIWLCGWLDNEDAYLEDEDNYK